MCKPDRLTRIVPRRASCALATVVAVALSMAGCGDDSSPTAPTTAPPTTPIAAPTITETWDGTVPVGGSSFYSFSIEQNGTVDLTLVSVSGTSVPPTVWLGLGIGTPSGTECVTTTSVNTAAGASPQLTGTFGPGVFCAKVSDIGNLFGRATFTLVIGHP